MTCLETSPRQSFLTYCLLTLFSTAKVCDWRNFPGLWDKTLSTDLKILNFKPKLPLGRLLVLAAFGKQNMFLKKHEDHFVIYWTESDYYFL